MKIKASSPCRLSCFGGGTDVDSYAVKYGGLVISMAIDIRQEFIFDTESSERIPAPGGNINFYDAFLRKFKYTGGFKQNFDGLINAGMGSSAAAAVAMVGAMSRLNDLRLSKNAIAQKAWEIETIDLDMYGGKQDQYASVFGGFNLIRFGKNVEVERLDSKLGAWLKENIVLIDTGIRRKDTKIQEGLRELSEEQRKALSLIKDAAYTSLGAIKRKDLSIIAIAMQASWSAKKLSNNVSTPEIDTIYNLGINNGALTGKACGAGGGGYMLFLSPPFKQEKLIKILAQNGYKQRTFDIDYQGLKVEVIK